MEDYIKCELIGGGSLDIKIFPTCLLLLYVHIYQHNAMYCCYCWLHPCRPCCPLLNKWNIPCHVAIMDCVHIGSATSSIKDVGNMVQENTTADILVEHQLWPPFEHGNS